MRIYLANRNQGGTWQTVAWFTNQNKIAPWAHRHGFTESENCYPCYMFERINEQGKLEHIDITTAETED